MLLTWSMLITVTPTIQYQISVYPLIDINLEYDAVLCLLLGHFISLHSLDPHSFYYVFLFVMISYIVLHISLPHHIQNIVCIVSL